MVKRDAGTSGVAFQDGPQKRLRPRGGADLGDIPADDILKFSDNISLRIPRRPSGIVSRGPFPVRGFSQDGTYGWNCFRIAVYQVFMVLQAVDYFLILSHDPEHHQEKPSCVACALNRLYDAYWQSPDGDFSAFPEALDRVARDFYQRVCQARGWAPEEFEAQNDAALFMDAIIDWIREDLEEIGIYEELFDDEEEAFQLEDEWKRMFTTTWVKTWTCPECHYESEKTSDQTLLEFQCQANVPFQQMFDAACRSELDTWRCERCQTSHENLETREMIRDPPEILLLKAGIFGFDQQSGDFFKHEAAGSLNWNYETQLDITKHLDPTADGVEERIRYRLTGVILHRGDTVNEGHYVALTTMNGMRWNTYEYQEIHNASDYEIFEQSKYGVDYFTGYHFTFVRIHETDEVIPQSVPQRQTTEETQDQITDLQRQLTLKESENKILQEQIQQGFTTQVDADENHRLRTENEKLRDRVNRLQNDLQERNFNLFDEDLAETRNENSMIRTQLQRSQRMLQEARQEVQELQQQLNNSQHEGRRLQREARESQGEVKLLEDAMEKYREERWGKNIDEQVIAATEALRKENKDVDNQLRLSQVQCKATKTQAENLRTQNKLLIEGQQQHRKSTQVEEGLREEIRSLREQLNESSTGNTPLPKDPTRGSPPRPASSTHTPEEPLPHPPKPAPPKVHSPLPPSHLKSSSSASGSSDSSSSESEASESSSSESDAPEPNPPPRPSSSSSSSSSEAPPPLPPKPKSPPPPTPDPSSSSSPSPSPTPPPPPGRISRTVATRLEQEAAIRKVRRAQKAERRRNRAEAKAKARTREEDDDDDDDDEEEEEPVVKSPPRPPPAPKTPRGRKPGKSVTGGTRGVAKSVGKRGKKAKAKLTGV